MVFYGVLSDAEFKCDFAIRATSSQLIEDVALPSGEVLLLPGGPTWRIGHIRWEEIAVPGVHTFTAMYQRPTQHLVVDVKPHIACH